MKSKFKLILLFLVFLFSCKVKKNIHLEESKSKFSLKSDSTYIVEVDSSMSTVRSYVINYDSSGKLSQVKINEVIKQAEKTFKTGIVSKEGEQTTSNEGMHRVVERDKGRLSTSWIVMVVLVVVGFCVYYLNKKKL